MLQRLVGVVTAGSILPPVPVVVVSAKNLPDPVSVDTSQAGTAATLEPVVQIKRSLERLQAALNESHPDS